MRWANGVRVEPVGESTVAVGLTLKLFQHPLVVVMAARLEAFFAQPHIRREAAVVAEII